MVSSLLFLLAGIFNACMDIVSHKFDKSIFRKYKSPYYFDPIHSWINKYIIDMDAEVNSELVRKKFLWIIPIPVMFTDFWHLCKSLMLICICLGTALSAEMEFIDLILAYFVDYNYWIYLAIKFLWFRSIFGLGFFTFYNYILIKK